MHIAIINQHKADVIGGSEVQCDIIADEMTARGHRVSYIAINGKQKTYDVTYSVLPTERSAHAISTTISTLQPDIVYWRFNKHCFAQTAKSIHSLKIPIVFSVSHVRDVTRFYFQPGAWKGGLRSIRRAVKESWRLFREHSGFRFVDALVTLNPDFLNKAPVTSQTVIPNSMRTECVPFEWPKPFCLWVANIKERKQPEKFIELAKLCQESNVDFLMVGQLQSKSYEATLKEGPANFHYLGEKTLEEVNGMLAKSLFLVHTCLPEGFSNNFIQAWLQKKTVVSLAFDPGNVLSQEKIGLYSQEDPVLFKQQVQQLIDTPSQATEYAVRGYAFATRQFSAKTNIPKLESLLLSIITQRQSI